jgi:hypothetical protein
MDGLTFSLVDEAAIDAIPAPVRLAARCQTCDYWERLEGSREGDDTSARRSSKKAALMAGARLAGSYGMVATDAAGDVLGYAQFGPLSAYPRAQLIRDRYSELPESPAPWVITCLQVVPDAPERVWIGQALAEAVCTELDRRGVIAVETYLERASDPWLPSGGPAQVYEAETSSSRFTVGSWRARSRWDGVICWPRRGRPTRATHGHCRCPRA